jgi:hypothetical protein
MDLVLDESTPVADTMFWMGAGVSGAFVCSALPRGANYVAGDRGSRGGRGWMRT